MSMTSLCVHTVHAAQHLQSIHADLTVHLRHTRISDIMLILSLECADAVDSSDIPGIPVPLFCALRTDDTKQCANFWHRCLIWQQSGTADPKVYLFKLGQHIIKKKKRKSDENCFKKHPVLLTLLRVKVYVCVCVCVTCRGSAGQHP